MTDTEILLAIQAIKSLKARYFFYLDNKDWTRWQAEVWAPDATLSVPEVIDEPIAGAANIVAWTAARFGDVIATHHGHTPIIDVTSSTTATGIWAMEDILRWPEGQTGPAGHSRIHGFGHYRETYATVAGEWRIAASRLTRTWVELAP